MNILKVSFEQIANLKEDFVHSLADKVIVYENGYLMGQYELNNATRPPIRIDALAFVICRYGEISFTVDYRNYCLKEGNILCLNNHHILDSIKVSDNYKGYALIISPDFIHPVIREIPNIAQLIKDTISPHPMSMFEEADINNLTEIVLRIKKTLNATSHAFQSQILKNEVSNFIFEIADIFIKRSANDEKKSTAKKNHHEETMLKFIQLILEHCKEEHEVSFYAEQLNMTPGNLTRILKASSDKTPIKWISDALVTEAKILLCKPGTSIQLVSDELHFGDQSSFGKFFKKHTGYTPVEYKNMDK